MPGFAVSTAEGGEAMRRILEERPADLVILDINMPGEDGLSLARYLRANVKVGIIMLTAAGEIVDRIVGLEMGADDYLAKPVDMRELLARVRAVLRRMPAGAPPAGATAGRAADPQDPLRPLPARSRRPQALRPRRRGGRDHQHGVRPAQGVRRASRTGC